MSYRESGILCEGGVMANASYGPSVDDDAPRLSRALYPELARELDRALARASEGPRSAAADFDARLDAAADARFAASGLGELVGSEGGDRLARAFASARRVAGELLGEAVGLPEPEAFSAAGVDLAALARHLEEDPGLVPVPAPQGLGAGAWLTAFVRAAELPESAFIGDSAGHSGEEPLVFAAEVQREFAALDGVAGSWTLRLVPAGQEPSLLGLNFSHGGPHVSLPEILMLQLMLAVEGEEPIDRGSFTWLSGELAAGRLAARHVFDAGRIRITAREVGSQGPHLGARPPVPAM